MMLKSAIHTDPSYVLGKIDPRIYSSFLEHLGRTIYDGIYCPDHPTANEDGFRTDVLQLVAPLHIPLMRYPGGNFVSGFRWEDSVGPREQRPVRLDRAWRTRETNQVGLQEFSRWCAGAGSQIMMAVNLGTRGVDAACNLLEYCNHPGGSQYSDLRIAHGMPQPLDIPVWCLGNEMDGPWQIGHKTATEYGRLACETARAMKRIDPGIQLVASGSSYPEMPTFPSWEATVLDQVYEDVEFLSLHQYLGDTTGNLADYLAISLTTESFIHAVLATCDYVQAKKRSGKKMLLSFDEWNIWYHSLAADEEHTRDHPWETAPALLEDVYTAADAVVFGSMLITLLKHADRIRIACLAQLVNAIAPIMTVPGGGPVWRQTIYWPFAQAAQYGHGTVLPTVLQSPRYDSPNVTDGPYLDGVVIHDEARRRLILFAVNRSQEDSMELTCSLAPFGACTLLTHSALYHDDPQAVNGLGRETVTPRTIETSAVDSQTLTAHLPPVSWNMILLQYTPHSESPA